MEIGTPMVTIPGFDIQKQLFESPFYELLRASRVSDGLSVILKVPKPGKLASTHQNMFLHDYELSLSLDTENVVQVHDLLENQSRHILVLEDFGAVPLKHLLVKEKILLDEKFSIALKVVKAIEYIHTQNIIHKNINPQNLFYSTASRKIKITGFGIASRLKQELPVVIPPNIYSEFMPYISPEQSGRMNRSIDLRTDFYSLGITLYELFTGKPPFFYSDPLELIHCHIAKEPIPPHEISPDIPRALSDIIMKLLSKNAEDRYQGTYGLKKDLKACVEQWKNKGRVDHFYVGKKDVSDKLFIPQKLYGRDNQIELLMDGFRRISRGKSELMLVTGYSGIGKSALIKELYKPITRAKGYFISGKFDQLQRNKPYYAFIEAFRELSRQILSATEDQVDLWRSILLEVLEDKGQIIVDVIPEMEHVLGPQKPVPVLPPHEAQNRFNSAFQNFIKVFTNKDNPVAVFLDDLQWADMASLSLIKIIIGDPNSKWLYLLGAYRDNEVSSSHPLSIALEEMRTSGAQIRMINLPPLDHAHVNCLITDTLKCEPDRATPLTDIVFAKTKGNPFFLNEFIKSLFEDNFLVFNYQSGQWDWNLGAIQEKDITDNVVDLMVSNIRKLSAKAQRLLKIASCIGNRFQLKFIALVNGKSIEGIKRAFWESLNEGLIVLHGSEPFLVHELAFPNASNRDKSANMDEDIGLIAAEFVHDRVQQAAYSIISKTNRDQMHLELGRQMLANSTEEQVEENLFDIVDQFNRSMELVDEIQEKLLLARLNLRAGKKASESAAFKSAAAYLNAAAMVLDENSWNSNHELTWEIYHRKAECEFSSAQLEKCEETLNTALPQCKSVDQKVVFFQIRLKLLFQASRHFESIAVIRQILRLLGVSLPKKIKKGHIAAQFVKFYFFMGRRKPRDLIDLPKIKDIRQLNICAVIYDSIPSSYMVDPDVMGFLSITMANICLRHGNSIYAPFAYAMVPIVMVGVTKQFQTAYDFSMMAIELNKKYPNLDVKARIHFLAGFFSSHWVKPIKEYIPLWQTAYQCTLEAGDLHWHNYCVTFTRPQSILFNEHNLDDIEAVNKDFYDMHVHSQDKEVILNQRFLLTFLARIRGLEGNAEKNPYQFDESNYANEMANPGNYLMRVYYHTFSLVRSYLFEDYDSAFQNGKTGIRMVLEVLGNLSDFVLRFFYLLTILKIKNELGLWNRLKLIIPYRFNKFLLWHAARNCPQNFSSQYTLLLAEEARVKGKDSIAPILYDKAIQSAMESGFPFFTALSNELAANYYLKRGIASATKYYFKESYDCYQSWGAYAKTKHLVDRHPEAIRFRPIEKKDVVPPKKDTLDLSSAISASQAISSEINLTNLLDRLMRIIIENAGARKGLLIIVSDDEMKIEAIADAESEELKVLQSIPIEESTQLPQAVARYVRRTGENVVIGNAALDIRYINDPYISRNKPKSLLCTPIIHKDKVSGILYLENNITASAFTENHLGMLAILLPQIAISLENAKLFEKTKQAERALRNSHEELYKTKQYLETIIDNANVWLNVIDENRNILIWNKAAEEISGYTRTEVLGKNKIWRWLYPDNAYYNEIAAENTAIIDQGKVVENYETVIYCKNGEKRTISWHSRNLTDEKDASMGAIALGRDITETKRLEAQLIQAQKMEAIGTLAGGIAHDFNNLLMGIQGLTSIMLTDTEFPSCHHDNLKGIETQVRSASHLTNQLLGFARGGKYEVKPTDLNALIKRHNSMFARTRKEIPIRCDYAEDLWAVEIERMQMEQVLMNLFVNACQAMPEGGEICISTNNVWLDKSFVEPYEVTPGRYVKLSITDTGHGMDDITCQKIFDPFFTTKEVGKGTGLGLASTYGIINNHNGFITVASEIGKGSTFNIYLPCSDKRIQRSKPLAGKIVKGSGTILLVDDEDIIINVARQMLQIIGYDVVTANNGKEAIRVYEKNPEGMDLVIIDMIMPGLGGGELYDRLTQINPDVKVILSSGYSIDGDAEKILKRGCNGFIQKPFNMKDLSNILSEVLTTE